MKSAAPSENRTTCIGWNYIIRQIKKGGGDQRRGNNLILGAGAFARGKPAPTTEKSVQAVK